MQNSFYLKNNNQSFPVVIIGIANSVELFKGDLNQTITSKSLA
jgi:hypothetical protein